MALIPFLSLNAQLTKQQIEEVLLLQNKNKIEIIVESEYLMDKYLAQRDPWIDGSSAFGFSFLSGTALGAHESFTFGYKNSEWMSTSLENWYNWRPQTDAVFGKAFSWQKIWRDVDYAADRAAWNKWKQTWKVKTFWSWETLGAFGSHFVVKNTFATFVRDKMKHNNWWYSWKIDLLFGEQLFELLNEL